MWELKGGKKQIFIKDMAEISLYIDSHLVGKRAKRIFSRRIEWFLALDWIIHQRVPWEQNIRYIYLPSLQLSIIMWLSHLLASFSSRRNRYLFPKYRVTHIWAGRFRYGYTPWVCLFFHFILLKPRYERKHIECMIFSPIAFSRSALKKIKNSCF